MNPDFMGWMMGFPPGWCAGIPKSAARRCFGNAVVPQVAEAFGRRLLEHLAVAA